MGGITKQARAATAATPMAAPVAAAVAAAAAATAAAAKDEAAARAMDAAGLLENERVAREVWPVMTSMLDLLDIDVTIVRAQTRADSVVQVDEPMELEADHDDAPYDYDTVTKHHKHAMATAVAEAAKAATAVEYQRMLKLQLPVAITLNDAKGRIHSLRMEVRALQGKLYAAGDDVGSPVFTPMSEQNIEVRTEYAPCDSESPAYSFEFKIDEHAASINTLLVQVYLHGKDATSKRGGRPRELRLIVAKLHPLLEDLMQLHPSDVPRRELSQLRLAKQLKNAVRTQADYKGTAPSSEALAAWNQFVATCIGETSRDTHVLITDITSTVATRRTQDGRRKRKNAWKSARMGAKKAVQVIQESLDKAGPGLLTQYSDKTMETNRRANMEVGEGHARAAAKVGAYGVRMPMHKPVAKVYKERDAALQDKGFNQQFNLDRLTHMNPDYKRSNSSITISCGAEADPRIQLKERSRQVEIGVKFDFAKMLGEVIQVMAADDLLTMTLEHLNGMTMTLQATGEPVQRSLPRYDIHHSWSPLYLIP